MKSNVTRATTKVAVRLAACAALVSGAFFLVGCSSDDESGSSSGGSSGNGGSAGTSGTGGIGTGGIGTGGTSGAGGIGTGGIGTGGIGTGGTSGTTGSGGSGGTLTDLGEGDGQDVITIGDSYMNLILSGIQQSLERISGRDYRNYAVPGTLVLNEQIPGQYDAAVAADPDIKTVVMTGGGNDILGSSCTGTCSALVDQVAARLLQLRDQMAADGVQDVLIISYGYPTDVTLHESLDYSRQLLAASCTAQSVPRCHYIDPVVELAGKIRSDGIHPTDAGYDILGQMAWDMMQAEGMRR